MPSPDESPRSKVANLIGRFEIQSKRTSLSGTISGSSRSSSVVSQTSANGDAANAEGRERREWPPKALSNQSDLKPAFVLPSYLRPSVSSLAGTVASSLASAQSGAAGGPGRGPPPPPVDSQATTPRPSSPDLDTPSPSNMPKASSRSHSIASIAELKPKPTPVDTKTEAKVVDDVEPNTPKPETLQRKGSTLTITPSDSRSSAKTPTTARPPLTAKPHHTAKPAQTTRPAPVAAKRTPAVPAKTPVTPAVPAPPRTPVKAPKAPAKTRTLTPATSMPSLKPQHTGQSAASSSAARKSGLSARQQAAAAPARSKTPLAKPSPSRAKSPHAPVYTKTPTTGIYAPTAASLARSARAAAEAPPLPTARKVLNSDVADRLTRPTTASLSKARSHTPAPAPSAARLSGVAAAPIKKATTTTGTPSKASPGTPSRAAAGKGKSPASPAKKAVKGTVAAATVAAVPAVAADVEAPRVEAEPDKIDGVLDASAKQGGAGENGKALEVADEITAEELAPEVDGTKGGSDIEDLVNMLESKGVAKVTDDAEGKEVVEGAAEATTAE